MEQRSGENPVLLGGIEAGGTKFVCAAGTGQGSILRKTTFPTTSPQETLAKVVEFFTRQVNDLGPIAGLGIASFGPLDPSPGSPTYGYITTTPKPGWANFNFLGTLKNALDVPMYFDTDVNGAAFGEYRWGAGQDLDTFIYITVGTGIGAGAIANRSLIHGLVHPDMGHIRIPHDWQADPFPGTCPYHGDCLEGLASGPAMEKRWGTRAENLSDDHPAWDLEAQYLALALANFVCTLSPQRIILGGGVMQQSQLLPIIRQGVQKYLNGYVRSSRILDEIDTYIVSPGLGAQSGVLGAIALADFALQGN
ncbi:MAG: fructokinase [Chloroflexi bacterium RBG_16_54_18]|nr:MAG: fructokinase [Chloroflexi bacterium RBG_16_54_18]